MRLALRVPAFQGNVGERVFKRGEHGGGFAQLGIDAGHIHFLAEIHQFPSTGVAVPDETFHRDKHADWAGLQQLLGKGKLLGKLFFQQLLRGHVGAQAEDGIRFFIRLAQGDERRLVVGGFPIRIGAGVGEHTGFAGLQDVPQHFFGKHA